VLTGVKDAEVIDGDVRFSLVLPREAVSVPVMRRVLGGTLLGFGADEDCVADLLLAASEACTNVLRHGGSYDEYEVSARVDQGDCLLEIANGQHPASRRRRHPIRLLTRDRHGPAPVGLIPGPEPAPDDGVTIMRACVDDLTLRGIAGRGTVVSMRKQLTWTPAVAGRHAGPPGTAPLREAG
jgi:serine/threonine-protein kinase RsbW